MRDRGSLFKMPPTLGIECRFTHSVGTLMDSFSFAVLHVPINDAGFGSANASGAWAVDGGRPVNWDYALQIPTSDLRISFLLLTSAHPAPTLLCSFANASTWMTNEGNWQNGLRGSI
ncbi:hypothetical protein BC829DRAFT_415978 [Chytridium lagenaria]|nr:hypothetical protein BC829DRAFT_415978 [Chytridium lagenaria]